MLDNKNEMFIVGISGSLTVSVIWWYSFGMHGIVFDKIDVDQSDGVKIPCLVLRLLRTNSRLIKEFVTIQFFQSSQVSQPFRDCQCFESINTQLLSEN